MKEHQKELTIIKLNSDEKSTTASINYNNYKIGICQVNVSQPLPPQSDVMVGSIYNTHYDYTLILNKKEDDKYITNLNIALDCIQTNGFFELYTGVEPVQLSNLGVPVGTYINIGVNPEGIRYNLELRAGIIESKIFLSRIC